MQPADLLAPIDAPALYFMQQTAALRAQAQHEADTRADMLEALYVALPYVEDHEESDIYKTGAVSKALHIIRAAIKQAEAL